MQISDQQWTTFQDWLRQEVGDENYKSWLQPLRPSEQQPSEQEFTFVVPTRFMRDWVIRHYTDILKKGISQVFQHNADISYVVKSALDSERYSNTAKPGIGKPATAPTTGVVVEEGPESARRSGLDKGNPLDPRFTFDNFVVGKSNEFAYQAARRIAENDAPVYNPFFVYGGVGLGKTHLMQAISWEIKRHHPQRRVMYISAEKFLYHFVRALRDKTIMSFKDTFRNVDVLMIDDIQFIAGKDATQEEFFHTFDSLVNDQRQIILTADKSPHEMSNIEDRLRSRLGWGLATEIHKPSMETRLAILDKKATQLGVTLNRDVGMFLADRISSNVRELEGALNRLVAHATLVQTEITVDTAQELLKDLFRVYNRIITLDEIQKKVAEFYNIKMNDMHTSRRSRAIARPRQIAMFLAKKLTTKSFPEIGKSFGGRDHTTVMHAVKTIEKLMTEDPSLREDVDVLEKMLSNNR